MEDYQQRVVDEKAALETKITDLAAYINTPTFNSTVALPEQSRMKRQLRVMRQYAIVLGERIVAF